MPTGAAIRLRADQVSEAGAVLARAFQADPLQSYAFPDARERAERSPRHFVPLLQFGCLFGEVLTTPGAVQGAAVWLPPGAGDMTAEHLHAAGLDELPAAIGVDAAERFDHVLAYVAPLHERDVPGEHWYLMVIGVEPARHGSGIGAALILPILERADAEGVPCYLETAQGRNVSFYQHLGFRVMAEVVEPRSGLRLWTFRRDPPA